jgi:hypothetical protein
LKGSPLRLFDVFIVREKYAKEPKTSLALYICEARYSVQSVHGGLPFAKDRTVQCFALIVDAIWDGRTYMENLNLCIEMKEPFTIRLISGLMIDHKGKREFMNVESINSILVKAIGQIQEQELSGLTETHLSEGFKAPTKTKKRPSKAPTLPHRKIIHPDDLKQYGRRAIFRAIEMNNNAKEIERYKNEGGFGYAVEFYSEGFAKTVADAGWDVWYLGNEGGMKKWLAIWPQKPAKVNDKARKASWMAYGEPALLADYKEKHGIA